MQLERAMARPEFLSETARVTMIAWLARQADGAVAHSAFYASLPPGGVRRDRFRLSRWPTIR